MPFAALGLSAEILRAVADVGYTTPTPIQSGCIPKVLAGRDLLAAAQTGTGKTAGFTLPILERLRSLPSQHGPRVLVLTPTRELASQILESVQAYGRYLPFKATSIFGGVGMQPQVQALKRGVDIVVACPGRLLDHAEHRTIDLSRVDILVLDEADRMLDMGFMPAVKRVLRLLPARRQNLLFSATFSDEIRHLAKGLLNDPVEVDVAPRNAATTLVSQVVHPVGPRAKRALLSHLISSGDWQQVLVFTRTKHGADRLAKQLGTDGLVSAAIHGNKSQNARTQALRGFKDGAIRVLVATDIAARGLDIESLPLVVNYELPNVPEDYVHRIGRTGRAGTEGTALSLVSPEERKLLSAIQRVVKTEIRVQVVPGFENDAAFEPIPQRPPLPARHSQRPGGNGQRTGGNGARRSDERPRRHGSQPAR